MAFKRIEEESSPELISLIDVIFLLLIFFLVASSIGRPEETEGEITVKIPEMTAEELQTPEKKVVEVNVRIDLGMTEDGTLECYVLHRNMPGGKQPRRGSKPYSELGYREWPDIRHTKWARRWGQPVSIGNAIQRIEDLNKLFMERQPSQKPIIAIQAEEDVPIEPIVRLMGLCKGLNLSEVNLVLGNVLITGEE